jgi:hypothetical protein
MVVYTLFEGRSIPFLVHGTAAVANLAAVPPLFSLVDARDPGFCLKIMPATV